MLPYSTSGLLTPALQSRHVHVAGRPRPAACHSSFPGLADGQGSSGAAPRCEKRRASDGEHKSDCGDG